MEWEFILVMMATAPFLFIFFALAKIKDVKEFEFSLFKKGEVFRHRVGRGRIYLYIVPVQSPLGTVADAFGHHGLNPCLLADESGFTSGLPICFFVGYRCNGPGFHINDHKLFGHTEMVIDTAFYADVFLYGECNFHLNPPAGLYHLKKFAGIIQKNCENDKALILRRKMIR
tara:strand:- start:1622 stop:2137 length:516 start_codon:yes stop_codon:yes gene_type:complete